MVSLELQEKINTARHFIRECLGGFDAPVVMSSFGKDSMVMLHLIRLETRGLRGLPVLFHREPHHPLKYAFANRVIAQWDLTVYDYPPEDVQVVDDAAGRVQEVINLHRAGARMVYLPTGLKPRVEGEPWLCGLFDLYLKPKCEGYQYPWDLAFIGHKDTDVDPVLGEVPLRTRLVVSPGEPTPAFAYPLKDFTDADVWEYTRAHGLLVNDLRYSPRPPHEELEDLTYNPDYFRACTACMDRDKAGEMVACPRYEKAVPSVAGTIARYDLAQLPTYFHSKFRPKTP